MDRSFRAVLFTSEPVRYHYDGQLSTRQLTGSSAQVSDSYTFDAFGDLLASAGSTLNNFLYTGEQFDPNLEFQYLRARYLNQATGLFLSLDSFPGISRDPISLHKYLYASGNPVTEMDPSGNGKLAELLTSISTAFTLLGRLVLTLSRALGSAKFAVEFAIWRAFAFLFPGLAAAWVSSLTVNTGVTTAMTQQARNALQQAPQKAAVDAVATNVAGRLTLVGMRFTGTGGHPQLVEEVKAVGSRGQFQAFTVWFSRTQEWKVFASPRVPWQGSAESLKLFVEKAFGITVKTVINLPQGQIKEF